MTEHATGRRILLGVGAVVVVLAALIGLFAGANGATEVPEITAFGLVTLPTTPLTLALYGALLATLVLCGLFGLVVVASRFDAASGGDRNA